MDEFDPITGMTPLDGGATWVAKFGVAMQDVPRGGLIISVSEPYRHLIYNIDASDLAAVGQLRQIIPRWSERDASKFITRAKNVIREHQWESGAAYTSGRRVDDQQ